MARLREHYYKSVQKELKDQFGYKNVNEIPRLEKIVLNIGAGEAATDSKKMDAVVRDMELISGQKPVVTKARKSIAGFRLREEMPVGAKVTLRKSQMYEFLDRFVNIAMPRIKDFRGLSDKSFDGRGNYAMGIKEQLIFPEIDYDKVDQIRGMDVVFVTTAKTNEESKALLSGFNMPFTSNNG